MDEDYFSDHNQQPPHHQRRTRRKSSSAFGLLSSSSNSNASSSSSPSLLLDSADRGLADGGLAQHYAVSSPVNAASFVDRDAGDGSSGAENNRPVMSPAMSPVMSPVMDEDDDDGVADDSSEFDDFSDSGGEPVNIIRTVNGNPAAPVEESTPDLGASTEVQQLREAAPNNNSTENEVDEIYIDGQQTAASVSCEQLPSVIGSCRAVYDYDANIYDELTIRAGDRILVREKQADGWWLGEIVDRGNVGIFPATYVEEEVAEGK